MTKGDWFTEIYRIVVCDPIFKNFGKNFLLPSVPSMQKSQQKLSIKYLKETSLASTTKIAYIAYGVPPSFRPTFVKILEKNIARSFLYWDDANASVDSIKRIAKWMLGDKAETLVISKNSVGRDTLSSYTEILKTLEEAGKYFLKVNTVNMPGEFSVKGDVIDIWGYGETKLVRIEFFDQKIDAIKEIDLLTRMPMKEIDQYYLIMPYGQKRNSKTLDDMEKVNFRAINISSNKYEFEEGKVVVFADEGFDSQLLKGLRFYEYFYNYGVPEISVGENINKVLEELSEKYRLTLVSSEVNYLEKKLSKKVKNIIRVINGTLGRGIVFKDQGVAYITDSELFGILHPSKDDESQQDHLETFLEDIKIGDFVVHEDHGIGLFIGLEERKFRNEHGHEETKEYIMLGFAGDDSLYVPIEQKNRIVKFVGVDAQPPKLTRLDGKTWEATKKKIQKKVTEIAKELVDIYAKRQVLKGFLYKKDGEESAKLSESFPFILTKDQGQAYKDIKNDMEGKKIMDRLLVGDVGFGKTEIALKAAFKAVISGKQVAVLAPTTVLVQQHLEVFRDRLDDFGIIVEGISRLNTNSQNKEIIKKLNRKEVDIVIGTHRLLSDDVRFKDLGLLIIDEEQRFGVKQKEKIRRLRGNLDLLSMSATPIPRTLHMALSGIRDISIIQTPPPGRIPIKTSLHKFSWPSVVKSIRKELERKGQIFFVHNHVKTIYSVASKMRELMPKVKFAVAHGQMKGEDLAQIMEDYVDGKYDVLICTTIIGSGLDIPNVNTIIIDEAENLGLAELYQLRGRVGRSDKQAYCLLMYRGKTKEFINLIEGRKTEYEKELEESVVSIELEEAKKKESNGSEFGPANNRFGRSFGARLIKAKEKKRNERAAKRLKAVIEASKLGSGFTLSAKDLEIRGAGNLLGKEQHGSVAKIGLGLYMKILARTISMIKEKSGNSV